jgi:hypothetical protein
MSKNKSIYRVKFINQDKLYEIYCTYVYQSDMYGFVEIEELLFGEKSSLLVDPGEERLQKEFSGVRRSYIPMHSIVRIDEVEKEGTPSIKDSSGGSVTTFPTPIPSRKPD